MARCFAKVKSPDLARIKASWALAAPARPRKSASHRPGKAQVRKHNATGSGATTARSLRSRPVQPARPSWRLFNGQPHFQKQENRDGAEQRYARDQPLQHSILPRVWTRVKDTLEKVRQAYAEKSSTGAFHAHNVRTMADARYMTTMPVMKIDMRTSPVRRCRRLGYVIEARVWHRPTDHADWYWRTESFFEGGILKLALHSREAARLKDPPCKIRYTVNSAESVRSHSATTRSCFSRSLRMQ